MELVGDDSAGLWMKGGEGFGNVTMVVGGDGGGL
jgi:hypothetical protein